MIFALHMATMNVKMNSVWQLLALILFRKQFLIQVLLNNVCIIHRYMLLRNRSMVQWYSQHHQIWTGLPTLGFIWTSYSP